jgi:hypothetical protein
MLFQHGGSCEYEPHGRCECDSRHSLWIHVQHGFCVRVHVPNAMCKAICRNRATLDLGSGRPVVEQKYEESYTRFGLGSACS